MTKSLITTLLAAGLCLGAVAQAAETPAPTPEALATPEPTPEVIPDAPGDDGEVGAAPNIHGFITARYLIDDGKGVPYASENGYDVQFARVNIDGKAHPLVRYLISMELADIKSGAPTPFREAYVIWAPKPRLKWLAKVVPELRAGRMRRPGGIESFQDESELVAIDRSLFSGFLQNDDAEAPAQDFRDIGIRGGASAGPIEAMAIGMTNGTKGPQSNSQPTADEDDSKDLAGRLGFRVGKEGGPFFLRMGASSGGGRDTNNHTYSDDTLDVEYWNAAADIAAEFSGVRVQTEAAYGKRTLIDPVTGTAVDTVTGSAAYLLVSYRIRGMTAPYFRYAYRELSMNDTDDDLQIPGDWANEVTVGVNVQIVKKALTARAQYTLRSGFINPQPAVGPLGATTEAMNGVAAASIQAEF